MKEQTQSPSGDGGPRRRMFVSTGRLEKRS
jgi:hypothetical protein